MLNSFFAREQSDGAGERSQRTAAGEPRAGGLPKGVNGGHQPVRVDVSCWCRGMRSLCRLSCDQVPKSAGCSPLEHRIMARFAVACRPAAPPYGAVDVRRGTRAAGALPLVWTPGAAASLILLRGPREEIEPAWRSRGIIPTCGGECSQRRSVSTKAIRAHKGL